MTERIYYVDAVMTTPVKIKVKATSIQDAFSRAMDGAWQECKPEPILWEQAKITHIGAIVEELGPHD